MGIPSFSGSVPPIPSPDTAPTSPLFSILRCRTPLESKSVRWVRNLELQTFSLPQLIVFPDVLSPRHYFRVIVSERRNSRHRLKANLSRGRDAKSGVSRSGDRPITEVRNNDLSIPGSILSPFFTKDLISPRILDLPIHPRRRALNSCEWFDNRNSFWGQFTGWHQFRSMR